jgi:hypothetical protein
MVECVKIVPLGFPAEAYIDALARVYKIDTDSVRETELPIRPDGR